MEIPTKIQIKGIREGLLVTLGDGPWEQVQEAFLEHLDALGVTVRDGDVRKLGGKAAGMLLAHQILQNYGNKASGLAAAHDRGGAGGVGVWSER